MLVLGAQAGLIFGRLGALCFPGVVGEPEAFAVVGMAAFSAAVVRPPVTGIVLITELTGASRCSCRCSLHASRRWRFRSCYVVRRFTTC
ncbi:chloride channel protein [Paraburkholderia panacisoli]|uniref:chloride channel protein n=1 Tax=Paraburkholderia panacisoli TaxID=2603818 RepID=UPI001FE9A9CD|nr:chloride channel protein [Paraburkholderia panacisoli]